MRKCKQKGVILDIDDVCAKFQGFMCFLHNMVHGTSVTEADLTDWDFTKLDFTDAQGNHVTGPSIRETMTRFESAGMYAALPILQDADFAIQVIRDLGYKIIFVTARPDRFGEQTYLWLLKNKIVYDELVFAADKAAAINRLSDKYHFVLYVEDSAKHINNVFENCDVDKICCVESGHNKDVILDKSIVRVKSLFECIRYLKKTKQELK